MKTTITALALAALAGCAAPGGEPDVGPYTDAEFRRLAIEDARAARGGEVRGLRLTDLLLPPPREPRR